MDNSGVQYNVYLCGGGPGCEVEWITVQEKESKGDGFADQRVKKK